jgi:hypothetical protein
MIYGWSSGVGKRMVLVVLAAYAGMACLALFPLMFNLTTHLPGPVLNDYFHFHWNYWWMRHALTHSLSIYETSYVMTPFSTNLAYHTLAPFWFPLWALLEPLIGTIGAVNLIICLSLTLTAALTFLFLRTEGASVGWALLGGAALAFSPGVISAVYSSQVNLLGWFWLPALLLLWWRVEQHRTPIWALLFGAALWGAALTDLQYIVFAAFLLIPYGLRSLWRAPNSARLRLVLLGGLAVSVALILLWFIGPLPDLLRFDRSTLTPGSAGERPGIPFPLGYVWNFQDAVMLSPGFYIPTVGLFLLPAALIALLMRRRAWFWLWVALPPLVLSLGASINVVGVNIPLPFEWIHPLTGGLFRYPYRLAPVFALPLLTFIALSWRQFPRWLGVPLLLLVLWDVRLFDPLPIQAPPAPYVFYAMIGREDLDYAVIEVPVNAGSGEIWFGNLREIALQWYGMTHGKRMINGLLARAPIPHFWYLRTDSPLLSWLGQRRLLEPDAAEAELRRVIAEYPVGYIVIHQDYVGRNTPTNPEIIGYLNSLPDLVCPVVVERDAVVYRTTWHPMGCPPRTPPDAAPDGFLIDLGTPGDEYFIGWGWHDQEQVAGISVRWSGVYDDGARLYVDVPMDDYTVTIRAQAFGEAREVGLRVNGVELDQTITVTPDSLQEYTFSVEDGGGQHVELLFLHAPGEAVGGDPRRLALMVDWVRIAGE